MIRALVIALAVVAGCKQRGEVTIEVTVPDACEPATHVGVYLIRGALCEECACGACLEACTGDDCVLGCDGGLCTLEEWEAGVGVTPERAGQYAVIYQFVAVDGEGDAHEVASACADGLQLDKDGTGDLTVEVDAVCCN